MTQSSRVNKYKELRESIREEAGIQRDVELEQKEVETQEDDFLHFIPKTPSIENDTLVEAIVFDQLKDNKDQKVDRVLRGVKNNSGKEDEYNTRLDILSKIRSPQGTSAPYIDDEATSFFEQGHFTVNEAETQEVPEAPKMTIMERLAKMSPKEDAKKAQEILSHETQEEMEVKPKVETPTKQEQDSMIIPIIKREKTEKMQENIEKALESEEETPIIKILNYIIVALVVVFVVLCGMIVSQIVM